MCCLIASACVGSDVSSSSSQLATAPAAAEPASDAPGTTSVPTVAPTPIAVPTPLPTPQPTVTATPVPAPTPAPVCARPTENVVAAPASVVAALEAAKQHPGFADFDVSASVWVEGWGEVLTVQPDQQLTPASNQKLLVAIAAHTLLDPAARLRTSIELSGSDLVLRAAADPTLTDSAINALTNQVAAAGVTKADRLLIDVSAYPQAPRAAGWLDFQIPTYVGPLSGLMIANNQWASSDEFLADPALLNGQRVLSQLQEAGVDIESVEIDTAPVGIAVAEHFSPTVSDLVGTALLRSDNQHADLLLMELGRVLVGEGTLVAGAAAVDYVLGNLCLPTAATIDDGSGLSRDNQRSARQFQEMLRAVRGPVGDTVRSQLPVAGTSGTLSRRFAAADAGRVQAKTGTLLDARALSGYATTDSGRDVVFSIIVNGEQGRVGQSVAAIDALVTAVLRIAS